MAWQGDTWRPWRWRRRLRAHNHLLPIPLPPLCAAAWLLRGRLALRSAAHVAAVCAMQPLRHYEAVTGAGAAAEAQPAAGHGHVAPEQHRLHAQPQHFPAGYNPQVEELRQREFGRLQRHVYAGKRGGTVRMWVPPLNRLWPAAWPGWVLSSGWVGDSCALP